MSRHTSTYECVKTALDRKHAMEAAKRGRSKDRASHAYRCADCGAWHVGTSNGMRRPNKTIRNNHQLGGTNA